MLGRSIALFERQAFIICFAYWLRLVVSLKWIGDSMIFFNSYWRVILKGFSLHSISYRMTPKAQISMLSS